MLLRPDGPRHPVQCALSLSTNCAGGSQTSECYLYPRFEALEGGDTPSFAEVHAYLRDGIALDFVDDYRRHVPPPLPPADCPPSPRPLPPAPSPAGVCLSAAECESFCVLSRVDPAAAHRFMLEAMSRALVPAPPAPPPAPPRSPHSSSSSMNSEGRGFPSPTYYSLLRPPPGFETD
ncbi:unnamed protein product [Danaus chrysippus]|uniref:(African queen) hypothetical protein n=1 Tax=Danaus chrysippus TaxID=151541 RepID=A0A8J2QIK2_9NEOP|nr:unnamed protein product [Danaus chrysippus]